MSWKKRTELPVYKQLTQFQFDPKLLVEAYEEYTNNKVWALVRLRGTALSSNGLENIQISYSA